MFKLNTGHLVKAAIFGGLAYVVTGLVISNVAASQPILTLGGMISVSQSKIIAGVGTAALQMM